MIAVVCEPRELRARGSCRYGVGAAPGPFLIRVRALGVRSSVSSGSSGWCGGVVGGDVEWCRTAGLIAEFEELFVCSPERGARAANRY